MKKKILVIDDEQKVRELIADLLGHQGYQLCFAEDGPQGLEAAKRELPDLILLDVMMPTMDGFQVQKKLSEDGNTAKIPVVFVTARAALEDTMRAMSQGAAGYIEKPFDVKRLVRKVESLLEPKK